MKNLQTLLYISAGLFISVGILVAASSQSLRAASAVAYDSATGLFRVNWGLADENSAKMKALSSCRRRGGVSCQIIASCAQGGYGIIYRRPRSGYVDTIGVSCGYPSAGHANDRAKAECNARSRTGRCGVGPFWYDTVNDGHVPDRCKNRHASNDPCY